MKIELTEEEIIYLLGILHREKRRVFDYITEIPNTISEADRKNTYSIIKKLSEKTCEF
jgi:hypothetical protein